MGIHIWATKATPDMISYKYNFVGHTFSGKGTGCPKWIFRAGARFLGGARFWEFSHGTKWDHLYQRGY
jgi:hypothetical protein